MDKHLKNNFATNYLFNKKYGKIMKMSYLKLNNNHIRITNMANLNCFYIFMV